LKKQFIAASCLVAMIAGAVAVGNAQTPGPAPAGGAAPAAQGGGGRAGGGPPAARDTLGDGPWELTNRRVRVSVVTKGLQNPWGIAFLPDGDMLVTERPGRLRVIRKGVLDPTPLSPMPAIAAEGLGGLLDVTLHPNFAQNRLVYFAYSKPGATWGQTQPPPAPAAGAPAAGGRGNAPRRSQDATTAVYRARWDGGSTLADGKDVWVADAWHGGFDAPAGVGPATGSYGTRIVFDKDGTMFVSLGDRNYPPASQNMNSHIGKIVRLKDDGTVPADNPFVGSLHQPRRRIALVHGRGPAGRRRAEQDREGQELRLARGFTRSQLRRHVRAKGLQRARLRGAGRLLGSRDRDLGAVLVQRRQVSLLEGPGVCRRHAQQHRQARAARPVQSPGAAHWPRAAVR
jgi:hypothetical protein